MIPYKNGRIPKSPPLRWRYAYTTHVGLIDRPRNPDAPEKGWPENGHDHTGKPWIDAKTFAAARVLDDHMNAKGETTVSYATIALQARISRQAAVHAVKRLEGAGLLAVRKRRINAEYSDTNVLTARFAKGTEPREEAPVEQRLSTAPVCTRCGEPGYAGTALCGTHYQEWSGAAPNPETPEPPAPQYPCRDGCGRKVSREGARCHDCTQARTRNASGQQPAWMAEDWAPSSDETDREGPRG